MSARPRYNSQSGGAPQSQQSQQLQPQSPQQRTRDRSRLALLFSHQQRKNLALFTAGCLLYGYAFFQWQPDRSFAEMNRVNAALRAREQLRLEHRKAKQNGLLDHEDIVPDLIAMDEGPEWQRKMRARAGDMAWRREQEQLAAAGHDHYLRGGGGGDYFSNEIMSDEDENSSETTTGKEDTNKARSRRRRRKGDGSVGQALMDVICMMFIFTITRTIVRVCLLYRQFNGIMRAQGTVGLRDIGMLGSENNNITTTTTNTATTNDGRIRTTRNNSGRAALARLMVPQSIHAHAALLRTARFRAWVTQLNRERQQHGQPPLSLESLQLVMRDSDFSGNDYEALMRFHEEATIAESMGATQAEIDRCPQRILTDSNDELLHNNHNHTPTNHHNMPQECPICLESYRLQDRVRRIHCFHQFHVECIDPWLAHRAVCPVCKHPCVG